MKNNSGLEDIIKTEIKDGGPITFERFMEMALYYPGLGYYSSPATDIGIKGDFYTSPHLHPVFGKVLARQVEECWTAMGKPSEFIMVEQGAGKGYLAYDILDYLSGREVYRSLRYVIIDVNPHMVDFQSDLLKRHKDKVEWQRDICELDSFTGCFLSNELLDAFPVHLVQMGDILKEVYVSLEDDDFVEALDEPGSSNIEEYLNEFSISLEKGYRTEFNLRIRQWLKDVAGKMREGFIITVDYGYGARDYYSEERSRGTLMCYFRHQVKEDPYMNVGMQDLTAHVNFSSVKKWGDKLGLKTLGFAGQGIYMVSMGLDEIISEEYLGKDDYEVEVAKIKGLIMPSAMGESHKVMIQHKGPKEVKLRGFNIRNRVLTL
ncbi:MAG: SAM-dependent methyltransferase [Thermodesulfovibrionales bacterium]